MRHSHRKIDDVRTTTGLLRAFLVARRGRLHASALETDVGGNLIIAWAQSIEAAAVAKQQWLPTSRGGKTSAPNRVGICFMALDQFGYPLLLRAAVVKAWCREHKLAKASAGHAPTPEVAMAMWLHLTIRCFPGTPIAHAAASVLALGYFVVRGQLAARSGDVHLYPRFLLGAAGADYKKPPGSWRWRRACLAAVAALRGRGGHSTLVEALRARPAGGSVPLGWGTVCRAHGARRLAHRCDDARAGALACSRHGDGGVIRVRRR